MSGVECALSLAGTILSGGLTIGKFLYKLKKRKIYKHVKRAIQSVDVDKIDESFEAIQKALSVLHNFDLKRNMDDFGEIKRDFLQCLMCKERLPKTDKIEQLFGLSKEVVYSKDKFIEYFMSSKQKELIKKKEEQKKVVSVDLERMKSIHMHKTAVIRKTLDEFNLSSVFEDLHKKYEEYLMKLLEENEELKKLVEKKEEINALPKVSFKDLRKREPIKE